MVSVQASRLRAVKPGTKSYVAVSGTQAIFTCDFFEIVAEVDLQGGATETGAGYRLGFTQLQWIETNRATYNSLTRGDGWSEVKRDRPPARAAQACRDVASSTDPFTYPTGSQPLQGYAPQNLLNVDLATVSGFPKTVKVSHADSPSDSWPIHRINSHTGKPNYLEWAQLEFHFCTVLLVRRPDGTFHQVKHFYWNVHWNVNFIIVPVAGSSGATVSPLPSSGKNVMNFGPFIEGAATDARFGSLITAAYVTTCNTVANQEISNQIVTEGVRR